MASGPCDLCLEEPWAQFTLQSGHLEILKIFEQGVLHLHVALVPANHTVVLMSVLGAWSFVRQVVPLTVLHPRSGV